MTNELIKKISVTLILLLLGLQALIYIYNQKPSYVSFSKIKVIENFFISSLVII